MNKYLLTVGTFYNWLADEGVIVGSPMLYVSLLHATEDTAPAVLSADDVKRMAKVVAVGGQGRSAYEVARDSAVLAFLQDTGLRASECAGLLVEHVDLVARQAYVHADVAKGGRRRTVTFGFSNGATAQPLPAQARGARVRILASAFARPARAGHVHGRLLRRPQWWRGRGRQRRAPARVPAHVGARYENARRGA